jgi:hypothetical protein
MKMDLAMNRSLTLKVIFIAGALGILGACADKPGSEGWCNAMSDKNKSEWTGSDAKTFATHCVLESTTIGSEAWCNGLKETPKGEWTTQEVADFAKYCVVDQVSP